ncbi:MAG: hypothetical protein GX043_08195 [Desulfovibrionales bacterium]|nr:hypothetical protein [Desulfovibrionales bacterium]
MLKKMFAALVDGFKMLVSEAKWAFIRAFRVWEIRQIKKRLAEEYETLGKNYAQCHQRNEVFDPVSNENDLTFKQIEFLLEEIAHLENELVSSRTEYIKSRTAEQEV